MSVDSRTPPRRGRPWRSAAVGASLLLGLLAWWLGRADAEDWIRDTRSSSPLMRRSAWIGIREDASLPPARRIELGLGGMLDPVLSVGNEAMRTVQSAADEDPRALAAALADREEPAARRRAALAASASREPRLAPLLLERLPPIDTPSIDPAYVVLARARPISIPGLLDRLALSSETDPAERRRAAHALAALSELGMRVDHPNLVPLLTELMSEPDPVIRTAALRAMPMAGESTDRDLLRKLLRIARTEDDRRELAMDTLVRALVQHTAAHGNRARKRSARRLRDWGPDAVATLSDIAAGDDSNPSIPALRLLVDVDERAGIESAVDSARLATGSDLAEILAILSARGAAATGPLVEAFESPVTEGRHRLAIALGHLGGAAAPAVPVLANALDDPQEEVRAWSVFALARIGRPALEYLPRMEQVLAATPLEMAPQSFEALERLRATARDD